jgi:hypothetical protein
MDPLMVGSHQFPEAVFLGVGMQLLFREAEVWSRQTRVTVQKGHNF